MLLLLLHLDINPNDDVYSPQKQKQAAYNERKMDIRDNANIQTGKRQTPKHRLSISTESKFKSSIEECI